MPKTGKKLFDEKLKEAFWRIFTSEFPKSGSHAEIAVHLKKFMTASEIAILEKRLAALYFLDRGESLRRTSEKSGLAKKVVVAVKHGFRKPVPSDRKPWSASSDRKPERKERYFSMAPMYRSDRPSGSSYRSRKRR